MGSTAAHGQRMAEEIAMTDGYYTVLEDSGYEAGLAGKRLEDSTLWSQAWAFPSMNYPAYVMSGWVAGRAMRRIKEEGDHALT